MPNIPVSTMMKASICEFYARHSDAPNERIHSILQLMFEGKAPGLRIVAEQLKIHRAHLKALADEPRIAPLSSDWPTNPEHVAYLAQIEHLINPTSRIVQSSEMHWTKDRIQAALQLSQLFEEHGLLQGTQRRGENLGPYPTIDLTHGLGYYLANKLLVQAIIEEYGDRKLLARLENQKNETDVDPDFADIYSNLVSSGGDSKEWRSFEAAYVFARSLGISSQREWMQLGRSGKIPTDIPLIPRRAYNDWISWAHFLGAGDSEERELLEEPEDLKSIPRMPLMFVAIHGFGSVTGESITQKAREARRMIREYAALYQSWEHRYYGATEFRITGVHEGARSEYTVLSHSDYVDAIDGEKIFERADLIRMFKYKQAASSLFKEAIAEMEDFIPASHVVTYASRYQYLVIQHVSELKLWLEDTFESLGFGRGAGKGFLIDVTLDEFLEEFSDPRYYSLQDERSDLPDPQNWAGFYNPDNVLRNELIGEVTQDDLS